MKRKAKGIYRPAKNYTRGYIVQVRSSGKRYSKFFSDKKFGGEKGAFEQAVAYRKKLVAELDAIPKPARVRVGSYTPPKRRGLNTKGVTRVDSGDTHGYHARVVRRGKMHAKLFSDRTYGGKEEAFKMAVAYRNKLVAELDAIPENNQRRLPGPQFKNKPPGVVGISRGYQRGLNGIKHETYIAKWRPEPDKARSSSFSIKKYGEDTAFRMACKLRFEKMKEIHGDRYDVASYMDLYRRKAAVDKKTHSRR